MHRRRAHMHARAHARAHKTNRQTRAPRAVEGLQRAALGVALGVPVPLAGLSAAGLSVRSVGAGPAEE